MAVFNPSKSVQSVERMIQEAGGMEDQQTYRIIGAAMEVHRELGCGFLEAVYQEALERELVIQQIPYTSQANIVIAYKGSPLSKTYQPDFICYEDIIVEIKATSSLTKTDQSQMINYLKAAKLNRGLLINLGAPSLQYRRFVFSKSSVHPLDEESR
jgi:GxxExxY protein